MQLKRRAIQTLLVFASLAVLVCGLVGFHFYSVTSVAAERYVANSVDGPWVLVNGRPVVDFNMDGGPSVLTVHWVYRFQNPQNGQQSKRIYVTASGDRAFSYRDVLDPIPLLGFRP